MDGNDGNANNRFRNTGYLLDPVTLNNWHLLTVVGEGSAASSILMESLLVIQTEKKIVIFTS